MLYCCGVGRVTCRVTTVCLCLNSGDWQGAGSHNARLCALKRRMVIGSPFVMLCLFLNMIQRHIKGCFSHNENGSGRHYPARYSSRSQHVTINAEYYSRHQDAASFSQTSGPNLGGPTQILRDSKHHHCPVNKAEWPI